ncbi:DUF4873 domain-containing protein [Saccharothrix australiensis]|uniref:Uncharacterized protein DUF4873 n=1 Tax=Saccharothrix australiensis TaxID=2072 RepID=A0A495VWD9_9PSEU|nr:DUF4873 domain-containing protein [Saccharothrix australiensis]RKT52685.1 uncharacterized protein DUF4873 [Saccharothrix australiensis]
MPGEHGDHEHDDHEHDEDGYTGAAVLVFGRREVPVEVRLRGHFQPIDGRYHWYGRIAANDQVSELVEAGARTAELRTPGGSATGTLTDPDPWRRYRVAGVSTPPYGIAAASQTAGEAEVADLG